MKQENDPGTVDPAQTYYCVECGKCTGICPVSRGLDYSPRRIVKRSLEEPDDVMVHDRQIWDCLTCKLCSSVCPSSVDYIEFIKTVRSRAFRAGLSGMCSQGGQLNTLARMMSKGGPAQNRTFWTEGLEVADQGEVMYFAGCLPYFDTVFEELAPGTIDIAKSAVRLLNAAGVRPVVSGSERCCGHDLLWGGDIESFSRLAALNIQDIRRRGVSKVVVSCAECYRTLSLDYRKLGADFQVVHISQYVAELLEQGKLRPGAAGKKVTLHDSCRLGRHMGVYDPPREVLRKCGELAEMPRNRAGASCCGVGAFLTCGAHSKRIQMERLAEARSTAGTLVTLCPKCLIHFKCAQRDKTLPGTLPVDVELVDFTSLVAGALEATKP
jgi:Fe-S oxidoreductase